MALDGSWVVERMVVGGEMVSPTSEISLVVEGERVSGKAVNAFTGSMGDETLFGKLATTRMMGPPELMGQEQALLAHLDQVDSYLATHLSLVTSGETVVVLRRAGTK